MRQLVAILLIGFIAVALAEKKEQPNKSEKKPELWGQAPPSSNNGFGNLGSLGNGQTWGQKSPSNDGNQFPEPNQQNNPFNDDNNQLGNPQTQEQGPFGSPFGQQQGQNPFGQQQQGQNPFGQNPFDQQQTPFGQQNPEQGGRFPFNKPFGNGRRDHGKRHGGGLFGRRNGGRGHENSDGQQHQNNGGLFGNLLGNHNGRN
ncbi:hypothetical protein M3Y98_01155200 [Aphelenchoides besseyi]|nr:hypothetical protein M3Y98_01155200 [Aphelenchoides besseyi]KAI6210819.1 hypothetical protein M3Y96_00368500 [Aphelenchoides besseyi]